ncbi:serine hydrolase FSH [Trichoderma compactum]
MDVVQEDGPFDAILGFSNGAALAATAIAVGMEKDPSDPPFKAAIFICLTMTFRLDSGPLRITVADPDTITAIRDDLDEEASKTYDWLSDPGTAELQARMLHTPTVHVIGDQDEYNGQGHKFTQLCDPKLQKEKGAILKTCQAMESTCDRIMFSSY